MSDGAHQSSATAHEESLVKCQLDCYLKKFKAVVKSCAPAKDKRANANEKGEEKKEGGKKGGGGNKDEEKQKQSDEKEELYDVELSDTILFPEGGGQPADEGTIGDAKVKYVYRNDKGVVLHRTDRPLPLNAEVDVVVDWKRRFDHMQQHSGQHLISAIALNLLQWETKAWWLARHPAECHIEFASKNKITEEDLQRLEDAVNEHIRAAKKYAIHTYNSFEEAKKDENLRTRGISPDFKGTLRVIEIEGVDYNTCCGTHVFATSEIQFVKFTNLKPGAVSRVSFVAGDRARLLMEQALQIQKKLTVLLSCGPVEHADAVKRVQGDLKAANKTVKNALDEVATLHAERLCQQATDDSKKLISLHHEEALFPLMALADAFQAKHPARLALFTCGDTTAKPAVGQFLLVGPPELVDKLGKQVSTILEGKGGGRKGRLQGKSQNLKQLGAALAYLSEQTA